MMETDLVFLTNISLQRKKDKKAILTPIMRGLFKVYYFYEI